MSGQQGEDSLSNESSDQTFGLPLKTDNVRCRGTTGHYTDEWAEQEEMLAQADQMLLLKDDTHKDTLLSRLNTFRRNRAFCDVVLFVDGRELLAHRAVLAAISPPLFDLFLDSGGPSDEDDHTLLPAQALELAKAASQVATTSANRGQQPQLTSSQNGATSSTSSVVGDGGTAQMAFFEFPQADFESMEALVEFAYTARLRIASRRVKELYRTAFALQVFPVAQACAHWLAEHLTVSNCIGIRRQANLNEDLFLLKRSDTFIRDNVEAVVNESDGVRDFGAAESDGAHHKAPFLPSGDELAFRCLCFFQHKSRRAAGERIDTYIDSLTEKTHLLVAYADEHQQSNNNATTITSTSVNGGNSGRLQDANELEEKSLLGSCDLVKDYRRSKSIAANGKKTLTNSKPEQQPIIHVTGATPIKLNSACAGRLLSTQKEDIKFASRESLCSLSSCCSVGSVPSEGIAGSESLAGGNLAGSRQIICVQPTAPGFWRGADPRQSHQLGGKQYGWLCAFAGTWRGALCHWSRFFECSEELNIGDGVVQWRPLAPMCRERARFDASVVDGKVFAVAGSNGTNDLSSCEYFDPTTGHWTEVHPLERARSHNGCASLDGLLYCIGGSTDHKILTDCVRYDPKTDEWTDIAPLKAHRSQAGCTAWRGLVVCVGGCDLWNCLDSVEAYDPHTNQWRSLARLRTPRRGCAVAVLGNSLVEVLDSPNTHWRPGPSMQQSARVHHHAVSAPGIGIFVIGGFDGTQFLASMEVLESEDSGWRAWLEKREHTIWVFGNCIRILLLRKPLIKALNIMIRPICGQLMRKGAVHYSPTFKLVNTQMMTSSGASTSRYFAASMVPLLPVAYFVHGPFMDYALTAAIVLHSHWGIMVVIKDYARPLVIGETLANMAPVAGYIASVFLLFGLLMFNYNDCGLTKAFEMVFRCDGAGNDPTHPVSDDQQTKSV
uniref:BTB domain-containing protein n=1 Tax=Globodera rostochiensis TaxID=31243 RepID=A0A914HJA5_GLORO